MEEKQDKEDLNLSNKHEQDDKEIKKKRRVLPALSVDVQKKKQDIKIKLNLMNNYVHICTDCLEHSAKIVNSI